MMIELPDTLTKQGQLRATVMLGRLMPDVFIVHDNGTSIREATDDHGFAFFGINLYSPKEMHLAWRVLNWAWHSDALCINHINQFRLYSLNNGGELPSMSPTEAIRTMLDEVIKLAGEAGMLDAAAKEGE